MSRSDQATILASIALSTAAIQFALASHSVVFQIALAVGWLLVGIAYAVVSFLR